MTSIAREKKKNKNSFFKKNDLYLNDKDLGEKPLFKIPDQLKDEDFCVIGVIEYQHDSIVFLNWPIPRNILIVDMNEKK